MCIVSRVIWMTRFLQVGGLHCLKPEREPTRKEKWKKGRWISTNEEELNDHLVAKVLLVVRYFGYRHCRDYWPQEGKMKKLVTGSGEYSGGTNSRDGGFRKRTEWARDRTESGTERPPYQCSTGQGHQLLTSRELPTASCDCASTEESKHQ